jgi:hypothetical protein
VLRRKKDLLVTGECFFKSSHARIAADDERRHHERKDDDIPDGHHRQAFCLGFFFRTHRLAIAPLALVSGADYLEMDGLSRFFEEGQVDLLVKDHFFGDQELADLLERRQIIHEIKHQILEDHPQSARAHFTVQGHRSDCL